LNDLRRLHPQLRLLSQPIGQGLCGTLGVRHVRSPVMTNAMDLRPADQDNR
jgi:hypothetical protein